MRLRHFWNRWRREYLANLREFYRPRGETYGVTDVQVGDVVTVFEDDVKRCHERKRNGIFQLIGMKHEKCFVLR